MGGLDAVVLTGGIGENGAAMRLRILQRFDYLGLLVDEERNADARLDAAKPGRAHQLGLSRVVVLAVRTNEELAIARQTAHAVRESAAARRFDGDPDRSQRAALPLLRRFVREAVRAGRQPTRWRDISQPGQYACEEKVNLIGRAAGSTACACSGRCAARTRSRSRAPTSSSWRRRAGARLRQGRRLGADRPRGAGGTLHLREGLICAKRHIHMAPADASGSR
jgi:acetate kinase